MTPSETLNTEAAAESNDAPLPTTSQEVLPVPEDGAVEGEETNVGEQPWSDEISVERDDEGAEESVGELQRELAVADQVFSLAGVMGVEVHMGESDKLSPKANATDSSVGRSTTDTTESDGSSQMAHECQYGDTSTPTPTSTAREGVTPNEDVVKDRGDDANEEGVSSPWSRLVTTSVVAGTSTLAATSTPGEGTTSNAADDVKDISENSNVDGQGVPPVMSSAWSRLVTTSEIADTSPGKGATTDADDATDRGDDANLLWSLASAVADTSTLGEGATKNADDAKNLDDNAHGEGQGVPVGSAWSRLINSTVTDSSTLGDLAIANADCFKDSDANVEGKGVPPVSSAWSRLVTTSAAARVIRHVRTLSRGSQYNIDDGAIPFPPMSHPSGGANDGWVEFSVYHSSPGMHTLQMKYASSHHRPCLIRIDDKIMFSSVACAFTVDGTQPHWFHDEGIFDLGQAGHVAVAFRARDQDWPQIEAFRFIKFASHSQSRSRGQLKKEQSMVLKRIQDVVHDVLPEEDTSARWRKSPTAATFTFEVGLVLGSDEEVECVDSYLRGKSVKFIYGEAHDSVTVDGELIGDRIGGDNFPKVTHFDNDEEISCLTIGLSTWRGECAFTALLLQRRDGRLKEERPVVGANLSEPTWTYDRNRLGLKLWITSIYATKNKPVARYGFTLSSDTELKFNPSEFEKFWDWLIAMKNRTAQKACKLQLGSIKESHKFDEVESVREQMKPLHDFLMASFSCRPRNPTSIEGYLYGSVKHVSIIFDVFSIFIYRLPDGETFRSTLFVDGTQYDTNRTRLEEVELTRNEILALAISVALNDLNLLKEMGLIRSKHGLDADTNDDRELLPLLSEPPLFQGGYDNTPMARRAVTILVMAGLRRVTYDTVIDTPGWDVYCLASGRSTVFDGRARFALIFAAIVCGLIQVVTPTFLIYRGIEGEIEALTWDVYIVRLLYGLYAFFYEFKTWEIDNEERVVGWLCFLPEFSTRRLILGMLLNKLCRIIVSAGIIVLLLTSFTVTDVTLNALALYFVLDVDNLLVNDSALETIRIYQRQQFFSLKSKTAVEYRSDLFLDRDLPKLQELPARYFKWASHRVTDFCMALLGVGCLWMVIEPFVIGWEAVE